MIYMIPISNNYIRGPLYIKFPTRKPHADDVNIEQVVSSACAKQIKLRDDFLCKMIKSKSQPTITIDQALKAYRQI
jgi:hypothetical protein